MGFAYQPLLGGAGDNGATSLSAGGGTMHAAGQAISVALSRRIAAGGLAVTTTGQDAELSRAKSVVAGSASIGVSGAACGVSRGLRLIASSGNATLSGQVVAMAWDGILVAGMGALSVLPGDADIRRFRSFAPLDAAAGSVSAWGQSCAIGALRHVTAVTGLIAVTGQPASLYRYTPGTPLAGAALPVAVGIRIGL